MLSTVGLLVRGSWLASPPSLNSELSGLLAHSDAGAEDPVYGGTCPRLHLLPSPFADCMVYALSIAWDLQMCVASLIFHLNPTQKGYPQKTPPNGFVTGFAPGFHIR